MPVNPNVYPITNPAYLDMFSRMPSSHILCHLHQSKMRTKFYPSKKSCPLKLYVTYVLCRCHTRKRIYENDCRLKELAVIMHQSEYELLVVSAKKREITPNRRTTAPKLKAEKMWRVPRCMGTAKRFEMLNILGFGLKISPQNYAWFRISFYTSFFIHQK